MVFAIKVEQSQPKALSMSGVGQNDHLHSADTSPTFVTEVERLLGASHKSGTGVDLKAETKYIFDIENACGAYC